MQNFQASDGLTLAYEIDDFTDPWANADTIIMLHAAMGSVRRLYAWVPHLCRDYRVVRLDLRGHGDTEIPDDGQLTLERLTEDVFELMDELSVERAHLMGSSAGGVIAMHGAVTEPARVASLAAFATIPGLKMSTGHTDYNGWISAIEEVGVRAFLARTVADRFNIDEVEPGFVEWFLDEAARNDPALLGRFVTLMSGADFADRIGGIECRTLLVVPGSDQIHSMEEYQFCRDTIPNTEFIVYDGKKHNITDSDPDRCAQDLLRFLRSQR